MRLAGALAAGFFAVAGAAVAAPQLDKVKLPAGFTIETWAEGLPTARQMVLGPKGTLFVGTMRFGSKPDEGKVYAVRTVNGKREVKTILSGLNNPNGVAIRDGDLYVAEIHQIRRYDDIEDHLDAIPKPKNIAQLPKETHHGWRYIEFGPDNKLYVSIGGPCNVCDRDKDGFAQIWRMNADGSGREVVARGVRNSVGFTWQPKTNAFWFTDNGRDEMGDNVPDCELNKLSKVGEHFGFPACHAGSVVDPEFGKVGACAEYTPPVVRLGPHVAPLAVKFYTGTKFPAQYQGAAFVAQHGSWNRSQPIGYRIMAVKLNGEKVAGYEEFATGWLQPDGKVLGRPVDLLVLADGSMLVTDDQEGVIYRISYKG